MENTKRQQLEAVQKISGAENMQSTELVYLDNNDKEQNRINDEIEASMLALSKVTNKEQCCDSIADYIDVNSLETIQNQVGTVVKNREKHDIATQTIPDDVEAKTVSMRSLLFGKHLSLSVITVLMTSILVKTAYSGLGEYYPACHSNRDHMICPTLVAVACVGVLLLCCLVIPSLRQLSSDKNRWSSIDLAKSCGYWMVIAVNPLYNVAAVLLVSIITLLLQVFTIIYAVYKLSRQVQVVINSVSPRFMSQTAAHQSTIIGGFCFGNLTSIKTCIEQTVQLIFLPFIIPILVLKKIFTKPALDVIMPFIIIFIMTARFLKYIAQRR